MSKSIETDPARTVRGAVIRRGDTGYEEARLAAVWNERKPDRFPAVIVIAEDEQDVVRAVRLARSEGCASPSAPEGTVGSATACGTAAC